MGAADLTAVARKPMPDPIDYPLRKSTYAPVFKPMGGVWDDEGDDDGIGTAARFSLEPVSQLGDADDGCERLGSGKDFVSKTYGGGQRSGGVVTIADSGKWIWVAEPQNGKIRVIDTRTGEVDTWDSWAGVTNVAVVRGAAESGSSTGYLLATNLNVEQTACYVHNGDIYSVARVRLYAFDGTILNTTTILDPSRTCNSGAIQEEGCCPSFKRILPINESGSNIRYAWGVKSGEDNGEIRIGYSAYNESDPMTSDEGYVKITQSGAVTCIGATSDDDWATINAVIHRQDNTAGPGANADAWRVYPGISYGSTPWTVVGINSTGADDLGKHAITQLWHDSDNDRYWMWSAERDTNDPKFRLGYFVDDPSTSGPWEYVHNRYFDLGLAFTSNPFSIDHPGTGFDKLGAWSMRDPAGGSRVGLADFSGLAKGGGPGQLTVPWQTTV